MSWNNIVNLKSNGNNRILSTPSERIGEVINLQTSKEFYNEQNVDSR